MRAYSKLPCYPGVALALPISLCSTAPDFFTQRDNEVSKWVSIPSSVLGGEWCSRWEWGHFFLFMISAVFPMFLFLISSDWPPAPSGCCITTSPSPGRHHKQLRVPEWMPGLSSFIHLWLSPRFDSGQAMLLWPPDNCQSNLAPAQAQASPPKHQVPPT